MKYLSCKYYQLRACVENERPLPEYLIKNAGDLGYVATVTPQQQQRTPNENNQSPSKLFDAGKGTL